MVKKIGLAVAATIIALGLAEGVLRLTGLGALVPTTSLDPHTASRLDSGVFVFDRDLLWREPSGPPDQAHRGGHFVRVGDTLPQADGRLRVLVLGDSCVRLSRTNAPWSVRLEQVLGPDRVLVRNASLPGYTSWQGLAWLNKQLLAWQPDLVIVSFGWNDHWRATRWEDKQWARALDPARLRLLGLGRLQPAAKPLRVTADDYRANLQEIARLVSDHGGRTVVVLPPQNINAANAAKYLENGNTLPGDEPLALHSGYLAAARAAAVGGSLALAEADAWFEAVGEPILLLEADGIHPTDPGHELMAQMLAPLIAGAVSPNPAAAGLGILARTASSENRWAASRLLYERSVAAAPAEIGPRLGLAWLLATCPEAAVRDGKAGVAALNPISGAATNIPEYFDVRGAALAEAGRFAEAVAAVDTSRALFASQSRLSKDVEAALDERQALYAARQSFRLGAPTER